MKLGRSIARLDRRDRVRPAFADRLLPITGEFASRCALIHLPDPRPQRDARLAATALTRGLGNVADVVDIGVKVIDPWDHGAT